MGAELSAPITLRKVNSMNIFKFVMLFLLMVQQPTKKPNWEEKYKGCWSYYPVYGFIRFQSQDKGDLQLVQIIMIDDKNAEAFVFVPESKEHQNIGQFEEWKVKVTDDGKHMVLSDWPVKYVDKGKFLLITKNPETETKNKFTYDYYRFTWNKPDQTVFIKGKMLRDKVGSIVKPPAKCPSS
jgi:hypothetical protein